MKHLAFIVAGLFLLGCGDATFSGKGVAGKARKVKEEEKKEDASPAEGSTQTAGATTPGVSQDGNPVANSDADLVDGSVTTIGDNDKDEAMLHCLSQWKDLPFNQQTIRTSESIVIAEGFNGNNGIVYADNEVTTEPVLKYITYSGKNLNQGKIELNNPKGWYCVALNGKAMNNMQINVHCDAKLATFVPNSQVANKMVVNQNCP